MHIALPSHPAQQPKKHPLHWHLLPNFLVLENLAPDEKSSLWNNHNTPIPVVGLYHYSNKVLSKSCSIDIYLIDKWTFLINIFEFFRCNKFSYKVAQISRLNRSNRLTHLVQVWRYFSCGLSLQPFRLSSHQCRPSQAPVMLDSNTACFWLYAYRTKPTIFSKCGCSSFRIIVVT